MEEEKQQKNKEKGLPAGRQEKRKKIIIGIIAAAVLIAGGALLQRFVFQKPSVSYVPANFDQKSCITKKIEKIKPNQQLCKNSPDMIPAKTFYSEGWKVICCKQKKQ